MIPLLVKLLNVMRTTGLPITKVSAIGPIDMGLPGVDKYYPK